MQRGKCMSPAEFEFVTPTETRKKILFKGVPQVDMSTLEVMDTYHKPPASAVSHDVVYSSHPVAEPMYFHQQHTGKHLRSTSKRPEPSNFVSQHVLWPPSATREKRLAVDTVKHTAQRMLNCT